MADQSLLAGADALALFFERGEVSLAPLGETIPGRGQPLPEGSLRGPVAPRGGLPLLQQLAHPLAARLPVGGIGRDPFCFGDDPLPDLVRFVARLLAGCLVLLTAVFDGPGQRLQPLDQAIQVPDGVRAGH